MTNIVNDGYNNLISTSEEFLLPGGTTSSRPTGPNGQIRYNSDLSAYEGYIDSTWEVIAPTTTKWQRKVSTSTQASQQTPLTALVFSGLDPTKTYKLSFQAYFIISGSSTLRVGSLTYFKIGGGGGELARLQLLAENISGAEDYQSIVGNSVIFTGATGVSPNFNTNGGTQLGGNLTWALLEELPNHIPGSW